MSTYVTAALLRAVAPRGRANIIEPVATALNAKAAEFGLTTPLRIAHFIAQAAHETDGFATLHEYASGDAYDTRTDLGNTPERDGDGRLYKGRGIFQLTGRYNYRRFGKLLGLDLERWPEQAAKPELSAHIALLFWSGRKLNALADKDDLKGITKRINGGFNGLKDRADKLKLAKEALGWTSTSPA